MSTLLIALFRQLARFVPNLRIALSAAPLTLGMEAAASVDGEPFHPLNAAMLNPLVSIDGRFFGAFDIYHCHERLA